MRYIKRVLKCFLSCFVCLFSYLYSQSLQLKWRRLINIVYTYWISKRINLGEGCTIVYPCKIEGGGGSHIFVSDKTIIHSHCVLGAWTKYKTGQFFNSQIRIGNNCNIGDYTQITAINKIIIGNGLLTGKFVLISDNSHGGLSAEESVIPPQDRSLQSKGEVVIGDNVWIGDKASILSGVHIGDNVIIAANAVVTKDIPSNSVAAGMPAKVVKQII